MAVHPPVTVSNDPRYYPKPGELIFKCHYCPAFSRVWWSIYEHEMRSHPEPSYEILEALETQDD